MPDPAGIDKIINEYRQAIAAKDVAALEDLGREWLVVEQRLQADIDALAAEIARRTANGEILAEQYLWKMQTYQRTLADMERYINEYNGSAVSMIERYRKDAYTLGINYAEELTVAELNSIGVLNPYWERMNDRAINSALGALSEQSPWIQSLYLDYGDAAAAFRGAVVNGIARGVGVGQLAKDMTDAVGMGANRAMMCAQTEMARAYRSGTVEQYRQSGVVEYYVRLVKKETACLACLVLDGEKYQLEEDMQDHPRGYCDVIAKVKGVPLPKWEKGEEWLKRQDEPTQRRIMGNTRYEMWKNGDAKLTDMVYKKDDPFWGKQPAIKPLKNTRGYQAYQNRAKSAKAAREKAKAEARAAEKAKAEEAKKLTPAEKVKSGNIGGPPPSYNADFAAKHKVDDWRKEMKGYGLSDAEIERRIKQAESNLQDIVKNGNPAMRIDSENLAKVCKDGRFKTQFETGHSNGCLDNFYRAQAERNGLGAPMDLDPTRRPIYGYLEPKAKAAYNWDCYVDGYGDVKVLWDVDKISNRTTFTLGDSLGKFGKGDVVAAKLNSPGAEVLEFYSRFEKTSGSQIANSVSTYIELQIKDGASLADVKSIILNSARKSYYESEGIIKTLEHYGINILWK